MLDILATILEFLQGVCYAAYTAGHALADGVRFILTAVPYAIGTVGAIGSHPLFGACFSLCVGLGTIKFFKPGGD